jgi:hypothetical protein
MNGIGATIGRKTRRSQIAPNGSRKFLIELVAGGGFDLYIAHHLALPIVPPSRQRIALRSSS